MPTTQEILTAAGDLGKMVAGHDAAKRLESAVKKLQADLESQRLLNDFNRLVRGVAQKESTGQPIEVAEKRKLQELQRQLAHNLVLREFQTAQMDYVDLLRKIDEQVTGSADHEAPAAPGAFPGGPARI